MVVPTGEQHTISRVGPNGSVSATVTELAASLRFLEVGGVELVQDYQADSLPSWGSGIVLVPWPNRVEDGKWSLNGSTQQLDITEPDKRNAIHGLLRNTGYRVTDREDDAITLSATVFPQHGYPFLLQTSVRYALTDDGLTVTHGIHNASDVPAPVAIGTHPFLRVGDHPTESLTAVIKASKYFEVNEALLPIAEPDVAGTRFDLREGVVLGDQAFDTAFSDVEIVDGRSSHVLRAPDGSGVEMWADENFPYVQLFTTAEYKSPTGTIRAVAVEPMTAPPNALASGRSMRWLEPDEDWLATWGISYLAV